MLTVHLLGTVDFESARLLQEKMAIDLQSRTDRRGALLLCEHPPLVTVGREGSRDDLLADPREFAARRLEIRWVSRGGGCWVHLRGQLAIYPIVPLERLSLGPTGFRRRLEEALTRVASEFGANVLRRKNRLGIWSDAGQLGMTGLSVRRGMTGFGAVLNVACELEPFSLLRTNDSGDRVSRLGVGGHRTLGMAPVRESVIRHLSNVLGYPQWDVFSGHPLLSRRRSVPRG